MALTQLATLPAKANTLQDHWKYPEIYFGPDFAATGCAKNDELDEEVWRLTTEKYLQDTPQRKFISSLRQAYYTLKPLIPRPVQLHLRQKMVSQMKKRSVPAWPLDTSVELCLNEATLELLAGVPGNELPAISFWPGGQRFAFVLTHDVEQMEGCNRVDQITQIELDNGFRSAWYFVPRRYPVDPGLVRGLQQEGFEVGVHGLYHDGKLFRSQKIFIDRAQQINRFLAEWHEAGFRSPSLIRNLDWISQYLHIDYDTSAPTSEWYGAQPGGCRTVFPFLYENIVELPITLQQDHTLLEILKISPQQMIELWRSSIQVIQAYQGLVLLILHPDCMTSVEKLEAYNEFLQGMNNEPGFWHALPKQVARWWRDRQGSQLVQADSGWRIEGPAAEQGRVMRIAKEDHRLLIEPYPAKALPPIPA